MPQDPLYDCETAFSHVTFFLLGAILWRGQIGINRNTNTRPSQ